jgi:hypothetical protein
MPCAGRVFVFARFQHLSRNPSAEDDVMAEATGSSVVFHLLIASSHALEKLLVADGTASGQNPG